MWNCTVGAYRIQFVNVTLVGVDSNLVIFIVSIIYNQNLVLCGALYCFSTRVSQAEPCLKPLGSDFCDTGHMWSLSCKLIGSVFSSVCEVLNPVIGTAPH